MLKIEIFQELSVGSSSRNSEPLQPPVSGLESACCKDADQPSPVSVLESSFTDDLSSCSDCFESLNVDIQGNCLRHLFGLLYNAVFTLLLPSFV